MGSRAGSPVAQVAERAPLPEGPRAGQQVEIDGITYEYRPCPTGTDYYDAASGQLLPRMHSLRTWFSHHTDGVGAGPGWDGRWGLLQMTPAQMLARHGYIFTPDEVSSPSGTRTSYDGSLEGGMPDDIPYLLLEYVDTQNEQENE